MVRVQRQPDVLLRPLYTLKTTLRAAEKVREHRATINRGHVLSSIMINRGGSLDNNSLPPVIRAPGYGGKLVFTPDIFVLSNETDIA